MKRIENMLLKACGYSILVLTLFYLFAAVSGFADTSIHATRFFLILIFGFTMGVVELIYNELKLKKIIRGIIHYLILLLAFCIVFISAITNRNVDSSLIAIMLTIYTILYFGCWSIIHFISISITKIDNKIDSKENRKNKNNNSSATKYTSIISKND